MHTHHSCQWSSLTQSLDKPITLTVGCVMTGLMYGREITPDAPTIRMANVNQVYTANYHATTGQLRVPLTMIPTGIHPNHGWQCSKRDPARYFVGFHATSAGQKQQESMNHPEKKWKKLDNGKSADDAAGANRALSPDEVIEGTSYLALDVSRCSKRLIVYAADRRRS
ncbi:hypothetical protein F5141DRAFT_586228 [Pisolithus sp. B1]|nr:hypothetical protein F5141DRAFT_586228 [Pisolithus sp. B1]